ncbi:MAG: DUF11 domain-containing protein, partial [Sporichthyaceae bacterium]|nr:DUF11 domain-containing protein [Sporichthyaceae bacterium]
MKTSHRSLFVAVMSLLLALNNGAFMALSLVGVDAPGSSATAVTTPNTSLFQRTTKYISNADYPSGTYIHGDLNKNNSAYREGDCVPFKLVMTNLDPSATSETVVLEYDHFRAGNYGYWELENFAVDLGSNGTIDSGTVGSTSVITTGPVPDPTATTETQTITVTYTKPIGTTTATLYFCGELAKPFGAYGGVSSISGAPVHVGVVSGVECIGTNCNPYSIGNQDRSIQPAGILPFATLAISKSGPATATLGTPYSYTITVRNTGTGAQAGVSVSDTIATGLTINSAVPTQGTCSVSGQTVTCALGSVAAGASPTITINVTPTLAACGTVTNSSTLTPGPLTSNTVSTTVLCPDVSVEKAASAAVSAGGTATFTIVVSAGGTGDSTGVTLTDTLPAGTWTIGGPSAASCSITSGTLNCNFGTIANGTTRTVTLSRTTVATDCPSISNTARVAAAVDAVSTNNSSTAAVTVNCGAIGLTKTADAATVTAGSTIGYTLTVTNSGAGTATGVTITDTLPTTAGTSWTISPAVAGCSITSGVLTCNFGSLAPAGSATVHLSSPTTTASCGTVSNSASASTTNDGSSNAGPATILVNCPDVSVEKTASAAVSAGGTATFTIVVSAAGTGDSTGVTLTDTLPAGTWTIGGPSAASCSITSGT